MTNIWQDLRYGLRMSLNPHLGSEAGLRNPETDLASRV